MDIREEGSRLLSTLAKALKLEGLAFDEGNECVFVLDDRLAFVLYLDDEITQSIAINVVLGLLPQNESREEILYEFLCGNYCWNQTEGGTIGLDKTTNLITLCYLVGLPLDPAERIVEIVAKLASNAEYWVRKMTTIDTENSAAKQATAGSSGGEALRRV